MESPTFTPSLLVNAFHPPSRCHLFITDGKIQFCGDCVHGLAGQTVEMVDVDDDEQAGASAFQGSAPTGSE
jgi:hypothetical protein